MNSYTIKSEPIKNITTDLIKNITKFIILTFLSLILSSCNGKMNKQDVVTTDSESKALIGSPDEGKERPLSAVGTLAGSLGDDEIGTKLDGYDKAMMIKTSQRALEFSVAGSRVEWRNPDNENTGFTLPIKALRNQGRYCREYLQEIKVDGKTHRIYCTACRNHSSKWEII